MTTPYHERNFRDLAVAILARYGKASRPLLLPSHGVVQLIHVLERVIPREVLQ